MPELEEDQYEVLIAQANVPVPLGAHGVKLFGNVIVSAKHSNNPDTSDLKVGVGSKLSPSFGEPLGPGDSVTLSHPRGVKISRWAIVGANVGEGVLITHLGGWSE